MEEIWSTCALSIGWQMSAAEIEKRAALWEKDLVNYPIEIIAQAFEIYRKKNDTVPSLKKIMEIMDDLKPLALPNPDKERFLHLDRMIIIKIEDADFYEKYAEENGIYLSRRKKEEIDLVRARNEIESLTKEEKKKRQEWIESKFAEARKMINQYEA